MDKPSIFAFFVIICSIFSTLKVVHSHAKVLCDETLYPHICDTFMKTNALKKHETTISIRDIALKATLDRAVEIYGKISSMNFRSSDDRAKMAWEDCLELYEDTVHQMKQTISLNIPTNVDDIQTYLSAASTNHETCKNGFLDLNSPSGLESLSSISTIYSKVLSNALAINGAISNSSSEQSMSKNDRIGRRLLADVFPAWISKGDRKLLQSSKPSINADVVVAKDGSGQFKTISEAVAAAKKLKSGTKRFIIYVKAGVYDENVVVTNKMKNLMLIGDGIGATIVTSNKNAQDGFTTFRSATLGVSGDGFIAKGITVQNTAGPQKHQAVALRSGSDFSVFYGCSFVGYQDTLYVYSKRQFYRNCDIYGTVDFIFGNAVAVLQSCNIYARKPMSNQINTVTAQARTDPNENTGIIIHNCIIEAASDLRSVQGSVRTFLGRPWQMYSRTVVMKSNIDSVIDPAGWAPWSGSFALSTLYYAEYMNTGGGADTSHRVRWSGYHSLTSPADAGKFTVSNFLAGDAWIPDTGVPYTSGL